MSDDHDLTAILNRLCAGETELEQAVFDRIYAELHQVARRQMQDERRGHTLQPTGLAHEAYLRLVGGTPLEVESRAHFFGAAARAMRQVLVDHARARARVKRGGEHRRQAVDLRTLLSEDKPFEFLAVDEALQRLEEQDPRAGEVARLRLYAGLDNAETAELLGVSVRTIEREWTYIRTWIFKALQ